MQHGTAITFAKWLLRQPNVTAASPVIVRIGRRAYAAAQYTEDQDGVEETRLYIVGTMPPLHEKRRLCYATDDSEYAWHLIAWFRQNKLCTEWQEVHPFGSHFILALWSPVENWAAAQCQKKPYRRIPMTITPCDGPSHVDVSQSTEEEGN
jgi:hypothetical protein